MKENLITDMQVFLPEKHDKGKPESFPISTCSKFAEKSHANEWNNVDKLGRCFS